MCMVCDVLTKQHPCQLQDHRQSSTTLHVYIATVSTPLGCLFDKINCANSVHSFRYLHLRKGISGNENVLQRWRSV